MPEQFQTVYGRGLVPELKTFVHRPYLVVTMEDLWPRFADEFDEHNVGPYFVTELERAALERIVAGLPACEVGHRARAAGRRSTSPSTSPGRDGSRSSRSRRHCRSTPPGVIVRRSASTASCAMSATPSRRPCTSTSTSSGAPRSTSIARGVGDILCYWTGLWDWRMASDLGKVEARWPYDQRLGRRVAGRPRPGDRRGRRDPRRVRCRDPRPGRVAPLRRRGLPQRGLEPAPHRGRRAFRLLQPRVPDRQALPARPAGDPRRPPHERPPGQRPGADQVDRRPDRGALPARGHGRDLGRRGRGPADAASRSSSRPACGTRSPASDRSPRRGSPGCGAGSSADRDRPRSVGR